MTLFGLCAKFEFTLLVMPLWGGVHGFHGAFHPIQLPFPG